MDAYTGQPRSWGHQRKFEVDDYGADRKEPHRNTAFGNAEGLWEFTKWWAVQGSNLRPLPCEGNALPLS